MSCNYFLAAPILEHIRYLHTLLHASLTFNLDNFADLALIILLDQRRLVTIFTELQCISRTVSTNSGTVGKYACS